ncbi:hypothetical protein CDAR_477451 [Caerostris darwini]|uniref:Uncharacterized protein n=1 Tax=Caerostris darwini TaxID=1538125 RepID=A0AAV4QS02_9ARAC|nr:hypothetical protein CDAR_477451 [Caerostris darwini]
MYNVCILSFITLRPHISQKSRPQIEPPHFSHPKPLNKQRQNHSETKSRCSIQSGGEEESGDFSRISGRKREKESPIHLRFASVGKGTDRLMIPLLKKLLLYEMCRPPSPGQITMTTLDAWKIDFFFSYFPALCFWRENILTIPEKESGSGAFQ